MRRRRGEGPRPRMPAQCRRRHSTTTEKNAEARYSKGADAWSGEVLARRVVSRQLEDNRRLVGGGDLFFAAPLGIYLIMCIYFFSPFIFT